MDKTFDSVPLAPFPTPPVGDGVPVRTVAVAEADGDEDGDEDTGDEEPTEVEVEPKVAVEVRDPEGGAVIEAETPEVEEDEATRQCALINWRQRRVVTGMSLWS